MLIECKKSKHHGFYDSKKDVQCRWCEPEEKANKWFVWGSTDRYNTPPAREVDSSLTEEQDNLPYQIAKADPPGTIPWYTRANGSKPSK